MCDGITQGELGMELSLASRDAIAMGTAVALSHWRMSFSQAVTRIGGAKAALTKITPKPNLAPKISPKLFNLPKIVNMW